jgi:sigma-54 dependent transcriptional regulator, acetoin dehydrogenase operon transcriptional activator AcoR
LLLAAARADFLEDADTRLPGVPAHVAASWRRSASRGVHPNTVSCEYHADLDVASRLVRCALPVVEQLVEQLADIPVCVALTDDNARLLVRKDSSSWIGRILDRVYFAQGFGYAEGEVGTNGVGTVLEFGESVHIVGAEHFVEALQAFACAGAPVHDPLSGRIEGVLDISCLSDHTTPLMHSLVRSAAARIERNLLLDRDQLQQVLFETYSCVDARSREAVLAVGTRTVLANTSMQTLLGSADRDALQDHVRFLMVRHPTVDDRVDLPSGARVRLRGSTVTLGLDVAGMVGVVTILDEVDGTARPVRRGGPRRPSTGDSTSPAWRAAAAGVEGALRAEGRTLVLGEVGTGRLRLLSELFGVTHGGCILAFGADAVEAAPEDVVDRVRSAGAEPVLPVLRDVDRLSPRAAARLLDALAAEPDPPVLLAATATEPDRWPAATRDALLALFHHCATVPPLRDRSGDLPALAAGLLADLAPHRDVRLSPDALRLLRRYGWPGNVGQLRDALADAVRRRPVGRIEAADLPEYCQTTAAAPLRTVDRVERDANVAALRETGGNRVAAAAALGLARSTLYRKIRQYGITT